MPSVRKIAPRLRRALLAFYDAERRSLPWRERPEPYPVWVSEVMLQQTRVEAVLPYYRAWMERFPDLRALADAPLDEVLRAWEGLGYYARARNLHRAAGVVRDALGGVVPTSATALRELPGVGEYTAGAVASIAFGEAVPAVDGNVRRVFARLFDEPAPSVAWLRERASALVDPERPGDWNQALMDLGATVCTPRAPACERCPLHDVCAARRAGTVAERPLPKPKKAVPTIEHGVAVVVRGQGARRELLLSRRPDEGLLGGMWELPTAEHGRGGSARAAAARAARAAGSSPGRRAVELPTVTHRYSHFLGVYRPFLWAIEGEGGAPPAAPGGDGVWVDRRGLDERALSTAQRRIASAVASSWL